MNKHAGAALFWLPQGLITFSLAVRLASFHDPQFGNQGSRELGKTRFQEHAFSLLHQNEGSTNGGVLLCFSLLSL